MIFNKKPKYYSHQEDLNGILTTTYTKGKVKGYKCEQISTVTTDTVSNLLSLYYIRGYSKQTACALTAVAIDVSRALIDLIAGEYYD